VVQGSDTVEEEDDLATIMEGIKELLVQEPRMTIAAAESLTCGRLQVCMCVMLIIHSNTVRCVLAAPFHYCLSTPCLCEEKKPTTTSTTTITTIPQTKRFKWSIHHPQSSSSMTVLCHWTTTTTTTTTYGMPARIYMCANTAMPW